MQSYKEPFIEFIESLQDTICAEIERVDGVSVFREDLWTRQGGGGGRTRIISDGPVIEKGGVNISKVHGELPQSMMHYLKVEHNRFFACGISLVIHPRSPMVPTAHANYRYFELYDEKGQVVDLWMAGGADMTPYYLFEEDARHFHQVQKDRCDRYGAEYYAQYKKACDQYFYNHHRDEARGIGGTFFDYLRPSAEKSAEHWYNFTTAMGHAFLESYIPIVERRKDMEYTASEKEWQEVRRGRYVEFNLIHDKGTLFGLRTKGRIESILMSLPPHVQWKYDHHPKPGSREEELVKVLKSPRKWV